MAIHGKQLRDGTINIEKLHEDAIVNSTETIATVNDDVTLPTTQAVKDYVDAQITAQDLDLAGDTGTGAVDLDSQSLTIAGGTGLSSTAANQTVTLAIDNTVATLTGSQTLTNKTLTSAVLDTGVSGTAILDEDDMVSNSATKLATQQSIKKYVDDSITSAGSFAGFSIQEGTNTAQTVPNNSTINFTGTTGEIDLNLSASNQLTIGLPDDVTIAGNLTVNGTTTTLNTAELQIEDKLIELAKVSSPSNSTANGSGISIEAGTDVDKTFTWLNATGSWTSSEDMDLISGKQYKINGTPILTADNLNGLNAAAVDVSADSIAIIDGSDSNNSKKESIVDLVDAMAGSGITATNGVLSVPAATTPELNVVSISPDATTGGGAGNLINVSGSSYPLPSTPSGEVQLFVNGIAQELGGSSGSGDYYITTSYKIEWNSSDFDLETTDKIIISYVPA